MRTPDRDAEILCEEWLNSSGVIVRFSRKCLEIKALDEQECVRSDMAVCAFVQALPLRALSLETDQDALLALTESVIMQGTATVRAELKRLYEAAWEKATPEERQYLPVIQNRIAHGESCGTDSQTEPGRTGYYSHPFRFGTLPAV